MNSVQTYIIFLTGIFFLLLFSACNSSEEQKENESNSFIADKINEVVDLKSMSDKSKPVRERFEDIYSIIHSEQQHLYDSLRIAGKDDWSYLFEINENVPKSAQITDTLATDAIVFGWHPYWMGNAFKQYQFNLLSHVSWFAYDINPNTGAPNNLDVVEEWGNSGIIDQIHETNGKALLTITSHKKEDNKIFLANAFQQQEQLIQDLIVLLEKNNADGIDVNFEQIPEGRSADFTNFLIKLSQGIKGANQNYVLSLVLPKVNWFQVYDIKNLNDRSIIDFFIVTGYDYYSKKTETDGPIAPLKSKIRPYSIENSINDYLKQGLSRDRIVLGFPYYGGLWTSNDPNIYAEDRVFEEHLTYRQIKARFSENGTIAPQYDKTDEYSAYYIRKDSSGLYEKCWFEDSLTLSYKYDWVQAQDLSGIAIWTLGYDNSHLELWQAIAAKYTFNPSQANAVLNTKKFDHTLSRYIYNYRYIIGLAGVFYLAFLLIGLIIAFFDWRVRAAFFSNKTMRLVYLLSSIPIILAIYIAWMYIQTDNAPSFNHMGSLLLGLFLGVLSSSIIVFLFGKYRKNLP